MPEHQMMKLSNRERDILQALAAGKSRQLISDNLNISINTYDSHRKNIRIKLGIKNQMDWSRVLIKFQADSLND